MGHDITVDGQTNLVTGGRVNALIEFFEATGVWYENLRIEGFDVSALTLKNAIQTKSTPDDMKLFSNMISGNDVFNLSDYADDAFGYTGNDKIYGYGGNDSLGGGAGNDTPNGALYFDADGSGAGKAIKIAVLDGHPTLAYTDVLVF